MLARVFYVFKVFGKKFLIAIDKTVKLFSVFICQNSPVFRVGHGILIFCSQQWGCRELPSTNPQSTDEGKLKCCLNSDGPESLR